MTPILSQTSARHPKTSSRHTRHYPDTQDIGSFAYERALEKKAIAESNDSYSTVFNLYDTYTTPYICQTPLDIIQTPQTLSRTPWHRRFPILESTGRKGDIWQLNLTNTIQLVSIYYIYYITPRHLPDTLRHHPDPPRHYPDTPDIGVFPY